MWGFKSLYIHPNKTGERIQERDEPPPEPPTLLTKALEAVQPAVTIEDIASTVGLSVVDLRGLTGVRERFVRRRVQQVVALERLKQLGSMGQLEHLASPLPPGHATRGTLKRAAAFAAARSPRRS